MLFRQWVVSVTIGEFLGFCVPGAVGAVVVVEAEQLALPALVVAGAVEGAVLGWSQARILRRHVAVARARWVTRTAVAGSFAWLIGMLPSTFVDHWSRWPLPVVVLLGAVLAALLLCSIGVAQWFQLRHVAADASRWVWVTALAWCVGLGVFTAVTAPLWRPGQPLPLVVAIGVLGGLAMAATMAVVTGWGMTRLLTSGSGRP